MLPWPVFPLVFARWRWIGLVASLRYILHYLHWSQQIFSLRSDISEENVTFQWLACTSQESVKIRTCEKERNPSREGKNTRDKIKYARGKQHIEVLHVLTPVVLISTYKLSFHVFLHHAHLVTEWPKVRGILFAHACLAWRAQTSPIRNIAGTISYFHSNWSCW